MSVEEPSDTNGQSFNYRFQRPSLVLLVFLFAYPSFMALFFPDASVRWFWPFFVVSVLFVLIGVVNTVLYIGYLLGIGR